MSIFRFKQLLDQLVVMAHITINQYLQQVTFDLSVFLKCVYFFYFIYSKRLIFLVQVYEAIDNHEGSFCAELLSFKHPHVANPRLQVRLRPLR